MVMEDHIIALYCRIDDTMKDVPVHPQAKLSPSEVVTLAVLFAIKGKGRPHRMTESVRALILRLVRENAGCTTRCKQLPVCDPRPATLFPIQPPPTHARDNPLVDLLLLRPQQGVVRSGPARGLRWAEGVR